MGNVNEIPKKNWVYTSFLPHQKEIIESLLKGQDTIAIMATGGESLCYQLPALYLDGMTIEISPLIPRMKDQVDDLNARRMPAATCNRSLDYYDPEKIEINLKITISEYCLYPMINACHAGIVNS